MGTLRNELWLVGLVGLLACSADSGGGSRDGTQPTAPGAPAGNGTPNAGTAGSFGNSSTPAANTGGVNPVAQPQKPVTGGGLTPMSIDQCAGSNPAGLNPADTTKLMTGSGGPGALRWLYPYDGTVFPRGLLAPLLMWDGGAADAVYVHIKASAFEYKGCLKPSADGQLQLPDDVWAGAGAQTRGGSDPFVVELNALAGGVVSGPIALHITIAQATIKGSIYYNSYSSALATASGGGAINIPGLPPGTIPVMVGSGGLVLRIPPGGKAEAFVSFQCNGCHSVSANGSRLISQGLGTGGNSFMLASGSPPDPAPMVAGPRSAYGALYPDGSAFLATSVQIEIARASLASLAPLLGPLDATLYKTDDGSVIANTGIPAGALMPSFSPDGKLLVFNDYAISEAHGIGLMDYDTTTNSATNYRKLYTDSATRPGWPFVLPDDRAVVFTRTDGTDFSGEGAGIAGINVGPKSDMYIADIKTGTLTLLAKAMGYVTPEAANAEQSYLPFAAEDLHKSYFPTLSPVAAGGYFWMFFDSVRHYGNLGLQRQLWGAAIEIAPDGNYALDRSHPAFYLPGQEFGTGNHRAFAALDPCKKDSDSCTSGTDCCGGFCYVDAPVSEFDTEPKGSCSARTPMCAKTNERCTSSANCCPPTDGKPANFCIAGFCAQVMTPQ